MSLDRKSLIEQLGLSPHPEGGHYKETFRSALTVETSRGPRSASTAIYFFLEGATFSAFHKVFGDEVWHFYAGAPLELHTIDAHGHHVHVLDTNNPQAIVTDGVWQAARIKGGAGHTLVGCTVAPGFDFKDFVMAERAALTAAYPAAAAIIRDLTRA